MARLSVKQIRGFLFIIIVISLASINEAQALPAFARQNGLNCITCHSSYPRLNPFGESFKDKGYSLTGPQTFQGPWEWKDFYPIAFQGVIGYNFPSSDPDKGDFSVNALQIFAGGPIGPGVVMYLHHHLVMDDLPGELHEAWLKWYPRTLPVEVKIGQFELPLANSPGKTILSHFGYIAYTATLGENTDIFASSKRGLELIWKFTPTLRLSTVYYQLHDIKAGFVRLGTHSSTLKLGALLQYGNITIGDTLSFNDRYYRTGVDFDFYLLPLEIYGIAYYGKDNNPHGDGDPGDFWTGFLEMDYHVLPKLVLGIRGEMFQILTKESETGEEARLLHEAGTALLPEKGTWIDLFVQYYIALNAKLMAEYLIDLNKSEESKGMLGVHYAF